jgi:uncharacterized phage protein (predicted DNA packaging)
MELDEIKTFLRVDGTDEDGLIEGLQLGAETYLTNAGVTKDYANDLYKLAVKMLIIHWYENRMNFAIGKVEKIAFSLESIIFSIKYNQPAVTV